MSTRSLQVAAVGASVLGALVFCADAEARFRRRRCPCVEIWPCPIVQGQPFPSQPFIPSWVRFIDATPLFQCPDGKTCYCCERMTTKKYAAPCDFGSVVCCAPNDRIPSCGDTAHPERPH